MFKCFVCNKKYNAADAVLGHIRFFHSNEIARKRLICCWNNCIRAFNNLSAYSKHIRSHKSNSYGMQQKEEFVAHNLQDSNDNIESSSSNNKTESITNSHIELSEIDNSNDFHQALTNAVITYVASLYDNFSLSEDEIQKVIDCHQTLLGAGFLLKKICF